MRFNYHADVKVQSYKLDQLVKTIFIALSVFIVSCIIALFFNQIKALWDVGFLFHSDIPLTDHIVLHEYKIVLLNW